MVRAQKILVIRFSSIGDIVLTTPVYRCIKQQLGAEVHLLVKKSFAFSIANNPYVDQVQLFDGDLSGILRKLKAEKYDFIIDLHNNLRSMRVKSRLTAPSASFDKCNIEKWLLVNLKLDRMPSDPHIVYRYMAACSKLGVRYDGAGMDFFIADEAEVDLSSQEVPLRSGGYVALSLGASMPTKALEYGQLVDIVQGTAAPVALLGGPAEQELGQQIANNYENAVSFAGKVSLQTSGYLTQQSAVLIASDTGMMHIGAALNHPVISVWGNTVPRFGMTPFYPDDSEVISHIVEVAGLVCRPCSKIGYAKCPKGHFRCIRDLSIQKVVDLANQYLKEAQVSSMNHD